MSPAAQERAAEFKLWWDACEADWLGNDFAMLLSLVERLVAQAVQAERERCIRPAAECGNALRADE